MSCMGPRAMATFRWRHRMPCRRSVASCAACTVDPRFSDTSASAYNSATSTAPRAASACPAGTCRARHGTTQGSRVRFRIVVNPKDPLNLHHAAGHHVRATAGALRRSHQRSHGYGTCKGLMPCGGHAYADTAGHEMCASPVHPVPRDGVRLGFRFGYLT